MTTKLQKPLNPQLPRRLASSLKLGKSEEPRRLSSRMPLRQKAMASIETLDAALRGSSQIAYRHRRDGVIEMLDDVVKSIGQVDALEKHSRTLERQVGKLYREVKLLRIQLAPVLAPAVVPEPTPSEGPSTAQAALEELEKQLLHEGMFSTARSSEDDPAYRGEKLLVSWTEDGTLVPAHDMVEAWGVSRQALDARVKAGQLFKVKVRGKVWYPAVLRDLRADQVARVCEAFGPAEGIDHLLFWQRPHGALHGKTVSQALRTKSLGVEAVARLARALAQERA